MLIRLHAYTDWFAPLLFPYGINRFSCEVAHIWHELNGLYFQQQLDLWSASLLLFSLFIRHFSNNHCPYNSYKLLWNWKLQMQLQATLFISKSRGPAKILRDISSLRDSQPVMSITLFMYIHVCGPRQANLSPMRAVKSQASLRIRVVSPEPPLLAHTSSESRGTFRQKARSLAPLNGWACAVKICHDGMLEDTNSLDGAHVAVQIACTNYANPLDRNQYVEIICIFACMDVK